MPTPETSITVEEHIKELRGNMTGFASIVGCYSMHLYCALRCDRRLEPPQRYQFAGPSESNCRKQARAYGWTIRGEEAICPRCSQESTKQ